MLFTMSTHYDPEIDGSDEESPSWRKHVQLTPVCRSRRTAASCCSEYWADLPFFRLASSRRFVDMLARSRRAPLQLILDEDSYIGTPPSAKPQAYPLHITDSEMAQLFDPARLLDIHLLGKKRTSAKLLRHFPNAETPKLRSLFSHRGPRTSFPRHILTYPRPALRELVLEHCPNPWARPVTECFFPQLEWLSRRAINPLIPLEISASVMLHLPNVQSLWVDDSFSSASHDSPFLSQQTRFSMPTPGKIELPLLCIMELRGDARAVHSLYPLLDLPKPMKLASLVCDYGSDLTLVNSTCTTFGISISNLQIQRSSASLRINLDRRHSLAIRLRDPSTTTGPRFFHLAISPSFHSCAGDAELRELQVRDVQTLHLEAHEFLSLRLRFPLRIILASSRCNLAQCKGTRGWSDRWIYGRVQLAEMIRDAMVQVEKAEIKGGDEYPHEQVRGRPWYRPCEAKR